MNLNVQTEANVGSTGGSGRRADGGRLEWLERSRKRKKKGIIQESYG